MHVAGNEYEHLTRGAPVGFQAWAGVVGKGRDMSRPVQPITWRAVAPLHCVDLATAPATI